MYKEIEVKFLLDDLVSLRDKLIALDARLTYPRVLEENLRLDTPDQALSQKQQILRLRRDSRNRITFKSPGKTVDGVLERTEIELEVDNFEAARQILEALGFLTFMVYEKYRETFELDDVTVTLDEMPFGNFAELEGPDAAHIQAVARKLGLNWERRSNLSYMRLFAELKHTLGLELSDLRFVDFENRELMPEHLGLLPGDRS